MTINITNAKPHPEGVQFDALVEDSSVALADLEGSAELNGSDLLQTFDNHADRIAEVAGTAIWQGYKMVNARVLLDTQTFHWE